MCCQAQPPATTHNTIDSDLYTDVTNIINNSCLKSLNLRSARDQIKRAFYYVFYRLFEFLI